MSPIPTKSFTAPTPNPSQRTVEPPPSASDPPDDNLPPTLPYGTIVMLVLAAATLIFVAVGIYNCVRLRRVTRQIHQLPAELPDHDQANNNNNNNNDDDEDEEEEEEQLRHLERDGYAPHTQIELGTARTAHLCAPGSAAMVDVRGGGGGHRGSGRRRRLPPMGLRASSSVRDVGALPDLSSAQAVVTGSGDEEKEKKEEGWESMKLEPGRKGALGRALKKRMSTQRLQGGGMKDLVRVFGF